MRDALERIHVLDILRGIALAGMFLVHFNLYAVDEDSPSRLSALYGSMVPLLFEERFWAMFGILFGVGFAVQMRRAEARGAAFTTTYLRRLAALAGFGFIAHAVFGFNVLLGYAAWGVPLLLVRNWPVRRVVIAAVISAASWSVFDIAQAGYRSAAAGDEAYQAERTAVADGNRAFLSENRAAQEAPHYPAVFRARLQHMSWFYAQAFSFLPVNTFTLFLLGVIGLRAGLFDAPARHQWVIAVLMVFGAASWAITHWLLPVEIDGLEGPLVARVAAGRLAAGFGVIREMWLVFAYIGAVLLVAAHRPAWLRWLAPFGWTGRMALTNYIVQIAILDVAFSNYALRLAPTRMQALAAAVALFGANALVSRWWLSRYRFGPLEWIWRTLTYGRPPLIAPART
ncbi:MAG: DUF418 domain-containing protein [Acidobacteria bacterium]|nr:DUF418 domain-containing protein [Acidobacteriota bacterium]